MSAQHQQARLNLAELRQLKWLLGQALALLSLWTLFGIGFIAGGLVVAACLVITATVVFPRLPALISGWAYRAIVFALIVFVALDFLRVSGGDLLPPLLRLVLGLTVLRCLQYRTRREDLQLVLLTMFVCVIAGVMTLSLAFAVQVLIYTPVAMCLLFLVNLLEPLPEQVLDGDDWQRFRWPAFFARVAGGLDFRLMGFSALLFASVVSVSSLIFITLPRFELDQNLSFLQMPGVGSIGFSDTVKFGDIHSILDDPSNDQVALRVEPPAGVDMPANPYWRMIVLDLYRDGTFSLSPAARKLGGSLENEFRRYGGTGGSDEFWSFFLEGNISRYLPLLGNFEMVRLERKARGSLNDALLVVQLQQTPSSVFGYRVENMSIDDRLSASAAERNELSQVSTSTLAASELDSYPLTNLSLPTDAADRALLAGLADQILAGQALSNIEVATAVMGWLDNHFSYSLSEDSAAGMEDSETDPLCNWLETGSRGWCEHFAGAMVLLLRAANVPARLVVGFNGATSNEYRDYLTVRNRYAHAWVEVFDGDRSWLRFDPTPARDVDSFTGEGLLFESSQWGRSWGAWIDSMRMAWYGNVVAFGQDDQEELADSLRQQTSEFFASLNSRIEEAFQSLVAWVRSPWDVARAIRTVIIAVGLLVGIALLMVARGWLAERAYRLLRSLGVGGDSDPVRRKAGRYLRRLYRYTDVQGEVPGEWTNCLRQLELIRYGRRVDRPATSRVFATARQVLSAARRGSRPKMISAGKFSPGTKSSTDHSGRA